MQTNTKMNVKVAAPKRSPQNLSHQVFGTNDFGFMQPISCQYLVPNESRTVKVSNFTRLLPMPSPTFGKIDLVTRCFFVPITTIWKPFLEYISRQVHPTSYNGGAFTPGVPQFRPSELRAVLNGVDTATNVEEGDAYDFFVYDAQNVRYNRKFTPKGKKMYSLLLGLGYNIPLSDPAGFDSYANYYDTYYLSALPLLALHKCYYDWIVPARFLNQHNNVRGLINSLFNNSNPVITYAQLKILVEPLESFWSSDLFTGAWEKPFSYDSGVSDTITISQPQPIDGFSPVTANTSSTYNSLKGANVIGSSSLNYYTLQSLGRLQDYLNRGMVAGNKLQDWLKTEFGSSVPPSVLDMSIYLGSHKSTIKIGDVMSMSDTESNGGAYLGQYAGRGLGADDCSFEIDTKDLSHGYLIVTNEIIPRASYYQASQPHTLMTDRFDFYQPEFDNVGVEPLTYKDICIGQTRNNNLQNVPTMYPNKIFGFVPRYAKLKVGYDVIFGDFRVQSLQTSLNSWLMPRDIDDDGETLNINEDFCKVRSHQNFNSIFSYGNDDVDHFYQIFDIEVHANRPMLQLDDALQPEHANSEKTVRVNTADAPNVD